MHTHTTTRELNERAPRRFTRYSTPLPSRCTASSRSQLWRRGNPAWSSCTGTSEWRIRIRAAARSQWPLSWTTFPLHRMQRFAAVVVDGQLLHWGSWSKNQPREEQDTQRRNISRDRDFLTSFFFFISFKGPRHQFKPRQYTITWRYPVGN